MEGQPPPQPEYKELFHMHALVQRHLPEYHEGMRSVRTQLIDEVTEDIMTSFVHPPEHWRFVRNRIKKMFSRVHAVMVLPQQQPMLFYPPPQPTPFHPPPQPTPFHPQNNCPTTTTYGVPPLLVPLQMPVPPHMPQLGGQTYRPFYDSHAASGESNYI